MNIDYRHGVFFALLSLENLLSKETDLNNYIKNRQNIIKVIDACLKNLDTFIAYGDNIPLAFKRSEKRKTMLEEVIVIK